METIKSNAILRALPSASLLLDRELRIIEASEDYLRVRSFKRDEIVGQLLFGAFPDNPNDVTADGKAA